MWRHTQSNSYPIENKIDNFVTFWYISFWHLYYNIILYFMPVNKLWVHNWQLFKKNYTTYSDDILKARPHYAIWLCQITLPRVMWTFCWHGPFGKVLPTGMPSRIRRLPVRIKESQMAKWHNGIVWTRLNTFDINYIVRVHCIWTKVERIYPVYNLWFCRSHRGIPNVPPIKSHFWNIIIFWIFNNLYK